MDFQLEVAKGTVRKSCIFPEISQFEKETFPRFERSCESHRDRPENKKKPVSIQCPAVWLYCIDYVHSRSLCEFPCDVHATSYNQGGELFTSLVLLYAYDYGVQSSRTLSQLRCGKQQQHSTDKSYHALDVRRRDCAYNYPTERFMHVYGMKSIRPRGGASLYNG